MAVCPDCRAETFRLEETPVGSLLACARCGRVVGPTPAAAIAELEREIGLLREELARLRQAVNFLNQRVR